MCLCVRAHVQMTLQPAVLTQRQSVRFQCSWVPEAPHRVELCKQSVLKRGTIRMRPFPQITSYAFVHKQVCASESVRACSVCTHCFPPSAFTFWLPAQRRATVEWISSNKTNCLGLLESPGSLESAKQWSLQRFIGTTKAWWLLHGSAHSA